MASSSKATAGRKAGAATANRDSIHVSRFNKKHSLDDFLKVCSNRIVLVERKVEYRLMVKLKFRFLKDLEDWKWWKLISFNQDVYVNAVRMFYFCGDNQKYDAQGNVIKGGESDDEFTTKVLGKEFKVNAQLINELLGIEAGLGNDIIPENVSLVEACKVVYRNAGITEFVSDLGQFDLHTRLLHLLICQCFNMKKGSFALISRNEMFILYRIIQRSPPDLGSIIVRKMVQAVEWSKKVENNHSLPYGKLVSRIVKHFCDVPSNEAVEKEPTLPKINDAVIGRMNYTYDPRKQEWVKKDKGQKRKEPETETATEAAQEAAAGDGAGTSTAGAAMAQRKVTNRELSAMMLRRFTVIDNMLTRMDVRLGKMGGKLEDLEAQIWEIKERLPLEDEEDEIDSDDMMTP